eukprot:jgi/Undpi1/283/HiC_scaffold_1.g00279.m1
MVVVVMAWECSTVDEWRSHPVSASDLEHRYKWQPRSGDGRTGGVSAGPNGSCTLAGWTYGNWSADHAGNSDWAAVNLDANGTLRWKWQNGTARWDELYATVTGEDGSVVMVGLEKDNSISTRFAAVKVDAEGDFLWEWKDESRDPATAYAVAATADGGAIWAGSTYGVWGVQSAGSYDFTASKLNADGSLNWTWQNGTSEVDEIYAAVVVEGDTVVLAGYTFGNWTSAHGGDNDTDFAAVKLDREGKYLWSWQNGTTGNDELYGAANGRDGSIVLAGVTEGAWKGAHAGGLRDFCAVKLDADGGEVWRWQGGTTEDDIIRGVASVSDGSVVLAGYTKGAWIGANDGSYDFAAVKLDAEGTEVWRWQDGSIVSAADYGLGVAAGPNGSVFLAGYTKGFWGEQNAEDLDDFVVVMLDTGATATPSPAAESSLVGDALLPTPTPTVVRASGTPLSRAPASVAPTITGPDAMHTPTPLWLFSVAPAQTASTSASFFSPMVIAIVGVTATLVCVCAGVFLRKKHQPNQNSNNKVDEGVPDNVSDPDEAAAKNNAAPSVCDRSEHSGTSDVVLAVLEAADNLAHHSQFPGVAEAATLVKTLVTLISNDHGRIAEAEARLKRCHLLVVMLERAATVLGKIDNVEDTDSSRGMKRMLIENVQDAIGDMLGLIRTYNSKKRITQVVVSTLFKRRMEETDAVINQTFADLMTWLHIDTALNQGQHPRSLANRHHKATGVRARLKAMKQCAIAESIVSDRRLRRQRNLDQIEIPADHVMISTDVLGKGGFGTVYIADYNGRNAAAKVILVNADDGHLRGECDADAESGVVGSNEQAKRQRASLLLELQAMMRLRSPHTVNVYGAITSLKDKLVLVMELLTGGDLRSLLKHSKERIPEPQARRIIQDVCAGITFLHSKRAVHGDLKSANVLLDGEGRAKIGDFGTSRWAQHTNSTGLATYNQTEGSRAHDMSFAWAAPEVLNAQGVSSASDVYSFGIVAWEVISMEIPWADEALPFDIFTRVVFKGDRPEIPADAPVDIKGVLRACWATAPEERPASAEILNILKIRALIP